VRGFSLKSLRQRDIALIIIALTLLATALWYFYMFRPAEARINDLNLRVAQLNTDIRTGEIARDNIAQLEAELARLDLERQAFLAELPLESEVSSLLDQLRFGAAGAGVIFNSVSKSGNTNEQIQGVRPIAFSVATEGDYPETMTFLSILESLQRFTKISQVGLSVNEQGIDNPPLSATYDFTVYVYTGEGATQTAAGAGQ
jgi:type IV pilus assembly protein PilO